MYFTPSLYIVVINYFHQKCYLYTATLIITSWTNATLAKMNCITILFIYTFYSKDFVHLIWWNRSGKDSLITKEYRGEHIVRSANVLQRPQECAMYKGDKVGNSSASSRGSLQQALPAFGGCFLPLPFVHCLFVLRVFALAATTSKRPLDELWARYAVPCLALWHRSQYSWASVITELPFNILN